MKRLYRSDCKATTDELSDERGESGLEPSGTAIQRLR